MNNYLLKYKTFDQLMSEVRNDFKHYEANGMIDESELIKIAQYINRQLGNKLRQNKEQMLYVEKGRVRLPGDFHKMNMAVLCIHSTLTHKVVRGDQREYKEVCNTVPLTGCEPCNPIPKPCTRLTECGQEYQIVETTAYETRTWKEFQRLYVKGQPSGCFNSNPAVNNAYIKNGWLYTNFDEGTVYISYLGQMEDEDGNLLVLDHDLVNPYYEYALKRRLLENLLLAKEDVAQNLNLIEQRYKEAKVEARTLINTPDKAEMDKFHDLNRQAHYIKYYHMFQK